jgi:hypothetical protein
LRCKGWPDIARLFQHPVQIECNILTTRSSSASTAGSPVPSAGPLSFAPAAPPDDESAVPAELVPGAVGEVPEAPPLLEP